MTTHKDKLAEANNRLMGLFKADQKTMMAFKGLADTAAKEGKISTSMKETIAVAIAAARGCEDCILYHVNEAKSHGRGSRHFARGSRHHGRDVRWARHRIRGEGT